MNIDMIRAAAKRFPDPGIILVHIFEIPDEIHAGPATPGQGDERMLRAEVLALEDVRPVDPLQYERLKTVIGRQVLFGPSPVDVIHPALLQVEIRRNQAVPGIPDKGEREEAVKLPPAEGQLIFGDGGVIPGLPTEEPVIDGNTGDLGDVDEDAPLFDERPEGGDVRRPGISTPQPFQRGVVRGAADTVQPAAQGIR